MAALIYLSGGQNNQDSSLSLGGIISLYPSPEKLFDLESQSSLFTAGATIYRLVYALSTQGAQAWKVWVASDTPDSKTTIAIGWATQAYNTTVPAIANQTTAPAGVTFSSPSTEATGLSGGDFPSPNLYRGLWVRLVIQANAVPNPYELASLVFATEISSVLLMENGGRLLQEDGSSSFLLE